MIRNALLVATAFLLPAVAHAQVKLLRHPTYTKGKVAFSYLGDIWTANENGTNLQRLTDNGARDVYPRYSPDGNWIAFSSNRDGNFDVFVVRTERRGRRDQPANLEFESMEAETAHLPHGGRHGRRMVRRRQESALQLQPCKRRLSDRRDPL